MIHIYKETNEINTKDTKDLVIHLGKTNKDKVGVIIEAKRPGNKHEMLTESKPNAEGITGACSLLSTGTN